MERLDYLDEELMKGSSTTQRYYERAVEYKQAFNNLSSLLIFLLIACVIQLIISIWNVRYIEIAIFLVVGAICYYYINKFLSRSDDVWREISTRKRYLNKEINSDDYEWVVGCCNKHSKLKGFVKKIYINDSQLKEKELRLFWLEFCKIENELIQSEQRKDIDEKRNILAKTIETD